MKRIALFLTAMLCLALCLTISALAEESAEKPVLESEGYRYRLLADGTAEILEYTGDAFQLILPETLDGHPVSSIGEEAFYGSHYSMEHLTIPASVTHIGSGAFSMTDLTEIEIPAGLVSMGDNPFSYCTSLKAITVAEDNPAFYVQDGVLFCREDHSLVCYPNLAVEPAVDAYETYTVPAGTEIIRGNAFGGVEVLSDIFLPDSLRLIGPQSFGFCWGLNSLTIPDSVTEIGNAAFDSCKNLDRVTLPSGLKRIPSMLFYQCESLTAVDIPDSVTEIGDSAFNFCGSLEHVRIPDGITAIETAVFEGCHSLKSVTIPDSVTEIGDFAFCSCTALAGIHIPAAVKRIGAYAFSDCHSLTELAIPDSVQSIGEHAFDSCPERLVITCGPDSFSKTYCEQNSVAFRTERKH
ncbi:MAG: leucine-rich repeat domain-containing protein [Clostridia bacterium]|nr:leucine-rich repeat domain-containing protein [Clostridia bacterium]